MSDLVGGLTLLGLGGSVGFFRAMKGTFVRRLIPVVAISGVLLFSYLTPLPSLASNGVSGYTNNCGVNGTGYHDHGKVCPNRPFPGKGP